MDLNKVKDEINDLILGLPSSKYDTVCNMKTILDYQWNKDPVACSVLIMSIVIIAMGFERHICQELGEIESLKVNNDLEIMEDLNNIPNLDILPGTRRFISIIKKAISNNLETHAYNAMVKFLEEIEIENGE